MLPAGEMNPTGGFKKAEHATVPKQWLPELAEPAKLIHINLPLSEERKLSTWAWEKLSFGNPGDNRSYSFTQ